MRKRMLAAAGLGLMLLALGAGAGLAAGGEPSGSWFVDLNQLKSGAHGTLDCAQCHQDQTLGVKPGAAKPHPDYAAKDYLVSAAKRSYDYDQCGLCHRLALTRYGMGAHAKAMAAQKQKPPKAGAALAPSCGDCHDSHYDRSHLDRLATGRRQVRTCGACHPAQAATYLQNFHGKAGVNLGNTKAAYCTDCHGAHTTVSLKDPKAAQIACARCHPGANASFAKVVIHPTGADLKPADTAIASRVAIISAVTCLVAVIVLAMIGFFYGHSFIWMLRDLHHKLRRYGHDR